MRSVDPEAGGGHGTPVPHMAGEPLGGFLDALDAGVYAVDDKGVIVAVNPVAERLLGRSAADMLGRDAHDLLHRDSRGQTLPRAQCPMMHAFLTGRTTQETQGWFERGDGSALPMSWLVAPFRPEEGTAGALVVFHPRMEGPAAAWERDLSTGPLSELERLALLAETTTSLTSTLDTDQAVRRLARLVVPRLADWAVIDLITENDEVWRHTVVQYEGGALKHHEELQGPLPPPAPESLLPLSRALRGAASTLATPATYAGPPDSGIAVEQRRLFEATGIQSAVISPIRGPREVLGALTLGRTRQATAFTAGDLPLLEDITRRAGLALDNARLYQQQRRVAETMQRHLLPRLPTVAGLEMTARYVAAPDSSQVGGDWYDAFTLDDGGTALAVGDVVGHDLNAAAGMAQLRNMLRAHAWSHREPPSVIVSWLDTAVQRVAEVSMATLVFGRVEADGAGGWLLRWTNAGHPPPLLVRHDGQADFLLDGHGILLGTGSAGDRPDAAVALPPRSTLVLYTDGLIESPRSTIDDGLARLRRHAAALAHRPLDAFCDLLSQRVRPRDNEDDVALLALRVPAAAGAAAAGAAG